MKRLPCLALLLVCALLSGCVKYRITLNNGESFTVLGKPKHDKENGVYRYKSGGEEHAIRSSRVISIEPAAGDAESKFRSSGY
jgi:hypothetical protein